MPPTRIAHGVLALPPTPPLKCGDAFQYIVPLSGTGDARSSAVEPQGVVPPGPALALRGTARCTAAYFGHSKDSMSGGGMLMLRVEPGKFESVSTVQMPGGEVRHGLPAASPRPSRDLAGDSP